MERGEADGNCTGWGVIPAMRPDWIRDDKVKVLVQFANAPSSHVPASPTIYDQDMSPELKAAIHFLTIIDEIPRPVAAPPTIPKERAGRAAAGFLRDFERVCFSRLYEIFRSRDRADATGRAGAGNRTNPLDSPCCRRAREEAQPAALNGNVEKAMGLPGNNERAFRAPAKFRPMLLNGRRQTDGRGRTRAPSEARQRLRCLYKSSTMFHRLFGTNYR